MDRLKVLATRYGGPVLAVALASGGTYVLLALTHHNNWGPLYAAIGASAWFAGLEGGIVATALSTIAVMAFAHLQRPAPAFEAADIGRIVTFVATGSFLSWLTAGRLTAIQTLQARARQQEAAAALSQRALSTTDIALLMQDAAVCVAQTLRVELTAVLELLPDGQEFLIRAAVGWQEGVVGRLRVGTQGLSGHSLRTRTPVIVDDLHADPRFIVPPELKVHDIKSSVSVPIYREGRPRGALNAHARARRQFTPDDVHFLQSIANVLAMALDRDRAEQALADNRQRLQGLFHHTHDALLFTDDRGRLTDANPTAMALTGWTRDELLGQPVWSLITAPSLTEAGWPAMLAERSRGHECMVQRTDGTTVDVELHVVANIVSGIHLAVVRDIRDRKRAQDALQTANQHLTEWVAQLERRTSEMKQLSEFGELLQSCRTLNEACRVVERSASRLFSGTTGAVYLLRSSQNLLEAAATWGASSGEPLFAPDDCWALRRGRIYRLADGADGIPCRHVSHLTSAGSLCVPMMARGEALGLLHLNLPDATQAADTTEQLANMVAESIALAVANLRLHESLQRQSIRDPLTGLFNRRYMEESFEREIRRAIRAEQPVTVVMLDLDHFKLFNDTYGHGAGDRLLKELGHVLQTGSRGEDIACRYGGEEFTLILPGLPLAHAKRYANLVRERVSQLRVEYRREWLGPLTISAGIAVYPTHGRTADAVLAAADTALYRAKSAGRNTVCLGDEDLTRDDAPSERSPDRLAREIAVAGAAGVEDR